MLLRKYLAITVFLLGFSFTDQIAEARSVSACKQALEQCWADCQMMGPLAYACGTGCNIGYLMCMSGQ